MHRAGANVDTSEPPAGDLPRAEPRRTHSPDYLTPSRSASAARHEVARGDRRMRLRRAWTEFLWLPTLVLFAYLLLAAGAIALDRSRPPWLEWLRDPLVPLIDRSSATTLLSGIATSVVTVTSITFSVLLLAVQQSASSLTPVVFDQFLRRRVNQLYLGMFIGLSVYAFVVLLSTSDKHAPVFGTAIALVLTVTAFLALTVLIYSTVDQMRPTSVVQTIHDRALRARRRELTDIRRTRRRSAHEGPVQVTIYAEQDGYVTLIDFDAIAAAVPEAAGSEVTLLVTLGDHVAVGDPLSVVKDDEEAVAREIGDAIRASLQLDRERDLDRDASFALSELGNIAWTTFSSAKHNPQAGRDAVDRMRDLMARWSADEAEQQRADEVLPVVYRDTDLDMLLDQLAMLLAATAEARQPEGAAYVLRALAHGVRVAPAPTLDGFAPALARSLSVVECLPASRSVERALEQLATELGERGHEAPAEAARRCVPEPERLGSA